MATTRKTAAQKRAEQEEIASTDLATQAPAGLPDLVPTSRDDFDIDARDITPPRIKAASPTTGAAADGLVPNFSLFSSKGSEDDAPIVLVEPVTGERPDLDKDPDFGLKVYVLRMYKNKAASVDPNDWQVEMRQGGELRTWAFNDPSAPEFARTQYNYVLFVPEVEDAAMPHNLLVTGSAVATARFINTTLGQRLSQTGRPIYTTAFRLHPEKRQRTKDGQTQRWAVVKAREVAADPGEVQEAQKLLGMISRQPEPDANLEKVSGTAPAI